MAAELCDRLAIQREIAFYNSLPVIFEDFIDPPALLDGVIQLFCIEKQPANPEKGWVPAYVFAICKNAEEIGDISLQVGYTEELYYSGQIGYNIKKDHRGNGYAGRACRLLIEVARAHGLNRLLITNNVGNIASARVCEKLGARFLRQAPLPDWHELYMKGQRAVNIYEWRI